MKKSSVADLILAAATLAAGTAKGDYYAFTSGKAIPLFDNTTSKTPLSYVTIENGNCDTTIYQIGNANGQNPTLTVNVANSIAGDYILSFLGTNKDNVNTKFSVTITAENSETAFFSATDQAQVKTTDWPIDTYGVRHQYALSNLPVGNFTLEFTVTSGTGAWRGHFGNFTLTKMGAAYDINANSGTAANLSAGVSDGWLALGHGVDNSPMIQVNGNGLIDSTHNGVTFTFFLTCTSTGYYTFTYQSGTHVSKVVWTLDTTEIAVDEVTSGDGKTLNLTTTHSLGQLTADTTYVLTGRINSGSGWTGNFGNFIFTSHMTLPTTLPTDDTIDLATAKSNGSLTLTGDGISIKNSLIDATKNNYTFTFHLYCEEAGAYRFSYKGGTHTSTVTWTLDGETIATDNFSGNGSTDTCSDKKTHNLGDFSAGTFHTLVGKVNCSQTWGGNYGYFQFIEAATTTIDSATVYVEKSWLATEYGSGTTTVPDTFTTQQSGAALSGAEAYALGYNSIPATGEVVVSPSISGTTMTFGFKDADADAAAARGAIVNYTLKTGIAAGSLSEGNSSFSLPTLDLATVDSVTYIELKADVSWPTPTAN